MTEDLVPIRFLGVTRDVYVGRFEAHPGDVNARPREEVERLLKKMPQDWELVGQPKKVEPEWATETVSLADPNTTTVEVTVDAPPPKPKKTRGTRSRRKK